MLPSNKYLKKNAESGIINKLINNNSDNKQFLQEINTTNLMKIDSENYIMNNCKTTISNRPRSFSFTNGITRPKTCTYHGLTTNLLTSAANGTTGQNTTINDTNNYHLDLEIRKENLPNYNTAIFSPIIAKPTSSTTGTICPSSNTSSSTTNILTNSPIHISGAQQNTSTTSAAASIQPLLAGSCARTLSFHTLLCSCHVTCCCLCDSLCKPDCLNCIQAICVKFTGDLVNNTQQELLPFSTLRDKVSIIHVYYLFLLG